MYRLLVVDDDDIERRGLSNLDAWKELDVGCVGKAWNGEEALRLCSELTPDIVITDVRMPVMDGITLARQLHVQYPAIAVILISGFEDFTAARSAVNAGALGYLVKPVNLKELVRIVKEATGRLDRRMELVTEQDRLRSRLEELMPVERERYIKDQLLGMEPYDGKRFYEVLQGLRLRPGDGMWAVMDIETGRTAGHWEEAMNRAIRLRFYDILQSCSEQYCALQLVPMRDNECVMVFTFPTLVSEEFVFSRLEEIAEALVRNVNESLALPVCVGLSIPSGDCRNLSMLYKQASQALRQKFSLGYNRVIWFQEEAGQISAVRVEGSSRSLLEEITKAVRAGDAQLVRKLAEKHFKALGAVDELDLEYVQSSCCEILAAVVLTMKETGEPPNASMTGVWMPYSAMLALQTLPDIMKWMTEYLSAAALALFNQRNGHSDSLLDKIKSIVSFEYTYEINAESIAARVYITPSHLRRLFKNKMGQTLQEYILQLRMQKVSELLRDPARKIHEVARSVGYDNDSYFGMTFKRYFGVTASEYKDRCRQYD